MITYEYRCEDGHVTELNRRVAQRNDPAECKTCGKPATKLMSRGNFVLKGGGWEKDGYSNDAPSSKSSS